jgi:hypothetical protein
MIRIIGDGTKMTTRTWLALLLLVPAAVPAADLDVDLEEARVEERSVPEHGKAATADPSPVDPGVLEAELGYSPTWNNRGGRAGFDRSEAGHLHAVTGTLTYGLVPDVDARISGGFGSVHDAGLAPARGSGLADLSFGARWRFVNLAAQGLEVAAIADAVAPSGSRSDDDELGLSQEHWSARGALVATKDFGRLTSNVELAVEAPVSGDAGGLRSTLQTNGALGYQVTDWLQPVVELNYEAAVGLDAQVLAVTAGVVAPFGAGHRIVAAVQQGVWGRNSGQTTAGIFSFKTGF